MAINFFFKAQTKPAKIVRAGESGSSPAADLCHVFRRWSCAACIGFIFFLSALSAQAQQVATPVFTPSSAMSALPFTVTVTCATPGATIYYTTDGSVPTVLGGGTSTVVAAGGVVAIGRNLTLRAIATANQMSPSAVQTAVYNVTGAVEGGGNFGLALKSDGTLWAWGYQGLGRLANGSTGQTGNTLQYTF